MMPISKAGKYMRIRCENKIYFVNARMADVISIIPHVDGKYDIEFYFGKKKHLYTDFQIREDLPVLRKFLKHKIFRRPNIFRRIFQKSKGEKNNVT
jgi:hypothetical protein